MGKANGGREQQGCVTNLALLPVFGSRKVIYESPSGLSSIIQLASAKNGCPRRTSNGASVGYGDPTTYIAIVRSILYFMVSFIPI
jgi:hypothetical protein